MSDFVNIIRQFGTFEKTPRQSEMLEIGAGTRLLISDLPVYGASENYFVVVYSGGA